MKALTGATLALALTGLASRVEAQPVSTRARAHFARGVTAADEGRAEAAMVEFSRVWELTHDPFVLFNIAVTHEALGHDGDALDAMERYERESPPLPPLRRAAVDAALRRLRARVATLALRLPVESAQIHVGGALVSAAAARAGVRLPAGVHRVDVSAPGYRAYETTIELAGGDRVVLDARLDPVRAPLAVECDVPGAEVLVDGERVGDTPMVSAALVPEGLHRVEVRRAGYVTFTAAVEVQAAGQRVRAELPWASRDAANSGRLVARTTPSDAVFFLDGRVLDAADGALVPPGPHRVRAERASYVPEERDVTLAAGETLRLQLALAPTAALRESWSEARESRRVRGVALTTAGATLTVVGAAMVAFTAVNLQDVGTRLSEYNDCSTRERLLVCELRAGDGRDAMTSNFIDLRTGLIAASVATGLAVGVLSLGLQQWLGARAPLVAWSGAGPQSVIARW